MASEPREMADRVVDAFRGLLDDDIRAAIGEQNFHDLRGMAGELIAEQSDTILDRLEADLRRLRQERVKSRQLEL